MSNVSFLDQLVEYLGREGVGNTTGANVNMFKGVYPGAPDNLVAILGQLSPTPNPNNTAANERPRFQILVRNTDFVTGEAKCRTIRALIDKKAIVTENFLVRMIYAESDIVSIGQDSSGREEFSMNFAANLYNEDSA